MPHPAVRTLTLGVMESTIFVKGFIILLNMQSVIVEIKKNIFKHNIYQHYMTIWPRPIVESPTKGDINNLARGLYSLSRYAVSFLKCL